jgi:DNA-binding transcriptional MerR regulator
MDPIIDKLEVFVYKQRMAQSSMFLGSYSTVQATRLTGIKRDMLNYLCKVGIVGPTVSRKKGERGHGTQRRYSFTDLVIFKVVQRLSASGVQPLKVKKAIRQLHAIGISISHLPSSHVVIFDQSVYTWNEGEDPFRMADGQMAFGFIVDVEAIHDELMHDLLQMAA